MAGCRPVWTWAGPGHACRPRVGAGRVKQRDAETAAPGGGLGAIYGVITLGMGVGAGMGSWISGMLYDVTGGYVACFAFSAIMAVFGLAQFWLVPALASGRRETA